MTVMGAETGTTTVTGTLSVVYTLVVPTAITLGPFIAAQAYSDTGKSITVSTNDPGMTNCGITIRDAKVNNPGYLTLGGTDAGGATKLTNKLRVEGGAQVGLTDLLDTIVLKDGGTPIATANIADFDVSQTIAAGDLTKTSGAYSLTMTFTATFS